MESKRARNLVEEIKDAGCLAVQFTGGGEPTVHPDHERIFEHTLSLGLRCSLVSNGINWKHPLIHTILPKFDWVRVSIDASRQDSYVKTRRCPKSHWDKVWANVARLSNMIAADDRSNTALGLGFVVTPDSWQEIVDFARLAKSSGVHNVRFSAMFSPEDEAPFIDIYDEISVLLEEAKQLATDDFAVYDNFGSRFSDLQQHAPDYSFCSYQHYTAYIGGDMQAYRCCVLAYNNRGKIDGGDLKHKRFNEFWESSERIEDFGGFDAKGCERCQFNSKNRGLLYIMDEKPDHIEWP